MSFGKFVWTKTSVELFINVENCAKHCEKSHLSAGNRRGNHVGIQLQKVQIGHLDKVTWQLGARETNHEREFCYRYDYSIYRDWLTQSTIGPLRIARSGHDHMVRNKLCWEANTPRTSLARLSLFLKVPLCNLRPNTIYSVHCHQIVQRAY